MLVIQISKSKEFDTLFILITWQLWKEQNARVSVAQATDTTPNEQARG